ncbi:linked kinase-associated serine/threonine phosphatase 2C [Seminavis robusta]|uniref:Linked kinase-associated serine/threonine phosphatase 2C n=1 Tax=Seminavis robusta TaxID=568900 RepID=A0A9N8E8T6_9STRA|nr:linked kinase-associated serine/threonine phosphatase 2C [Seminavis robusta]|eukprot:Sro749_g196760.1 linked kinase-associated serine/threonine phosphatase 2C (674) ;mRNA; r:10232-12389
MKTTGEMGDTSPGSDDEKSHTFRRRRLSLSKHHLAPEGASAMASAAAVAAAVDDDEESQEPPLPEVTTNDKEIKDVSSERNANEDDQKAQTFRKRRLSLTLKAPAALLLEEENNGEGTDKTDDPPKRQRRASDASAASLGSSHTGGNNYNQDGLKVRTLHAGEILQHHHNRAPPSPAVDPTLSTTVGHTATSTGSSTTGTMDHKNEPHVLYRLSRPPSSTTLLNFHQEREPTDDPAVESQNSAASPQPKWKKRITRKHDEDERKLPFPRDVVGTYSCHGVEPVYDSDYEHNLGDEDEEEVEDDLLLRAHDNWAADDADQDPMAPNRTFPTPNTGKPNLEASPPPPRREPKPTTAAKINQDRGGVAFPYGNCPKTALFAAYDGHGQGGELVSQFALHEIQSRLEKRPEFNNNLEKAFKDTFLAVDEALQHEPLIEPLYAGTTACVALLRDNVLTVANAGDSRAVVARKMDNTNTTVTYGKVPAYRAIDLTIDQNPDLPEERNRIESMGGFVSPPPEPGLSARVWLDEGFSQIGLAMARSIGDHAVARVGVIAEPVVSTHTVHPDDEFLIIATDGVWEFISSESAVEIVGANLSRGATKATQALIEAAAARWHDEEGDYRDDITALVVRLPELWRKEPNASKELLATAAVSDKEAAAQKQEETEAAANPSNDASS